SLCERLPSFDTRQWPEFEQIAETLRNFRRDAIESNNKRRTAQRLADDRIREHRQGIDRKLRRAEDQATTDALTGLRNRAFLEEEFDPLVLDCINRREDMCIIMIDVDNFKAHNDTYGHAAGDAILRFMGGLLSAALRPTDCAVRYGGDEFMLLLPRTSAREALQVAQRIVTLFRQNAQSIDGGGLVSLSAGVASLANANTTEPAELMARADAALYHAKAEGKNAAILDTRRIRSEPACVHRQSPSP
ncbi:MAG: GGDEF domain-containing protein, partial [Phycisphaerae bacterium]